MHPAEPLTGTGRNVNSRRQCPQEVVLCVIVRGCRTCRGERRSPGGTRRSSTTTRIYRTCTTATVMDCGGARHPLGPAPLAAREGMRDRVDRVTCGSQVEAQDVLAGVAAALAFVAV